MKCNYEFFKKLRKFVGYHKSFTFVKPHNLEDRQKHASKSMGVSKSDKKKNRSKKKLQQLGT